MKFLLIEGNPAMRTTLHRSFERRGLQIVTCDDGARALDRWHASVPDVVQILTHLGLQARAPARAAARGQALHAA